MQEFEPNNEVESRLIRALSEGLCKVPREPERAVFWDKLGDPCPLELITKAAGGKFVRFQQGESILGPKGDANAPLAERIGIIVEGCILGVGKDLGEKPYYGAIFLPCDVLGEYDLFRHGEDRLVELETLTEVVLFTLPMSVFIEIASAHSSLLMGISRSTVLKNVRHHVHLQRKNGLTAYDACSLQVVELARIMGSPTRHHTNKFDEDDEILIEMPRITNDKFAALLNRDESYVGTNMSTMTGVIDLQQEDLLVLRLRKFLSTKLIKSVLDSGRLKNTASAMSIKALLATGGTYDHQRYDELMKTILVELRNERHLPQAPNKTTKKKSQG